MSPATWASRRWCPRASRKPPCSTKPPRRRRSGLRPRRPKRDWPFCETGGRGVGSQAAGTDTLAALCPLGPVKVGRGGEGPGGRVRQRVASGKGVSGRVNHGGGCGSKKNREQ